MSHTWFRLYDEVVDDPKVQLLSDRLFRVWINLMCVASKNHPRGTLPRLEDTAYRLHMSVPDTKSLLNELIEAGLLEYDHGRHHCHNWHGRQFQSDVSTDRVKRFRKRHGNVSETAAGTLQKRNRETFDPLREKEKESNQRKRKREQRQTQNQEGSLFEDSSKLSTVPPTPHSATGVATTASETLTKLTPRQLFDAYNAERGGLPEARELTEDRLRKCHARVRSRVHQPDFIEQFRESVRRASHTPFLCGDGPRGWTASFDWFIHNDTNFQRVLEGKYDDKRKPKSEQRTKELNRAVEDFIGHVDAPVCGDLPYAGKRDANPRKT